MYKIHVDTRRAKKSVWGIISNAQIWRFIFIDEAGLLWKSDPLFMPLDCYDESKVLQVYRIVHYIVKCCYEACTPSPSTASSIFPTISDCATMFQNKRFTAGVIYFRFKLTILFDRITSVLSGLIACPLSIIFNRMKTIRRGD
jgi:hypothetical protein